MPPLSRLLIFALSAWLTVAHLEARMVRVASFNIENGPEATNSTDYAATKEVLARIDADVVAFQELLGPNETNWRSIATELGYPHVLFGTNGTSMSGSQRLGYFSRFPIASFGTVSSPPGANEMTRLPLRVVINVTGAAKPLVLWNMHHKADDTNSANTPGNQFRRAVEAYRIVQDINAYRAANPSHDEFIMVGDLNDDFSNAAQAAQFTNVPSVTSPSFALGADIKLPVLYRAFPDDRYASAGGGLHRLDLLQQNGLSRVTRPISSRTLDYILVSTALRDSPLGAPQGEVYNSQLDASFAGLPKKSPPLAANRSLAASDHLALFADINMDDAPVPSVWITSPGGSIPAGVPTTIEAGASVTIGTIASVEFFANGISIGVDTAAPFSLPWTPEAPGLYQLVAVARSSAQVYGASPSSTVTATGPVITGFLPAQGFPGTQVTITGSSLANVAGVDFGGVEAAFTVASDTEITAIVPPGALSGQISVSGPDGTASSVFSFYVTSLPTVASASVVPSLLADFAANSGTASPAQTFAVSAVGLGGPLQVSAPSGFELSLDGTNFAPSVVLNAPPRSDAATNYSGEWTAGSNEGRGFAPWTFVADDGQNGLASAYFGNPADSGVAGMGSKAFALRAEPVNSGAFFDAIRALDYPLAVGEALSFDWGVNWDANDGTAEKGLAVKSGFAAIAGVHQRGFPGAIVLQYGTNEIDTGLAYGTNAMRWTFRQLDAQTLQVTSTARTNSDSVAFSTNIPVPGAITGFMWFAFQMDSNTNRRSYYDNLEIVPAAPGGGTLSQSNVHVRLAANAKTGSLSGTLGVSSAGQSLASVAVSGTVAGALDPYDAWAQSHGLDPQGNGARGADADGDGLSNLHEFLFAGVPTQATSSLWRHELKPSVLVLTFVARASGASYRLLFTANLASEQWVEEASATTEASDQAGVPSGYRRRQVIVPHPTGNRFFRLQAVEAPQ